jgi:hypothetical protein
MSPEQVAEMRKQMEDEIRAQLQANSDALTENTNFDALTASAKQEDAVLVQNNNKKAADSLKPRLSNLNEDPQLSGVVHHHLKNGETTIGRKDAEAAPSGVYLFSLHIFRRLFRTSAFAMILRMRKKSADLKMYIKLPTLYI